MNKNGNRAKLSYEECMAILDCIDGLIVTDDSGNIKYMSEDMKRRIVEIDRENLPEEVTEKNISEVHPGSRIKSFLTNDEDSELAFYMGFSTMNISKMKRLHMSKGSWVIDYDLFSCAEEVENFLEKLRKNAGNIKINMKDRNSFENLMERNFKNTKYGISDIAGKSSQIVDLKNMIMKISESDSFCLIEAETGCGKELVAHAIHNSSRRMNGPLIEINCAAIPDTLFESELFGYEDGAFTGAKKGGKAGVLEMAENGTLFLDEIDQLPYHIQPKLLRVLQEKEFSRIGGRSRKMNVRIIAASNKNLEELVRAGNFREDLYYRLNVIRISIPPLRERQEDIPALIDKFIGDMNEKLDKKVKSVSNDVMKIFYNYHWPGNVRELMNVIERAMNMCTGNYIDTEDLGDFISRQLKMNVREDVFKDDAPLERAREICEREVILKVLESCGGNRIKAANILKISRSTLYNKLRTIKNIEEKEREKDKR